MIKSYKYRLLPDENQANNLENHFNCCRFVYNLALETKITAWKSANISLSFFDLSKQLTELKNNECQWLKMCNAQSLESSLKNMDLAYSMFFKGSGFPRFKRKTDRQSVKFRQGCKVENSSIYLSKIGFVSFIKHREIPGGAIGTVTVSKNNVGSFFVSIMIKTTSSPPEKASIEENSTVGVDMGLKTFATLSDGGVFENHKYLYNQLSRLKKEQRTLSRRFKKGAKEQSKGYYDQKLVVAKLHEKISNQRQDFLHKVSTEIIRKYDTICIEKLNIAGMMKNSKLSKAISDVGWHQFIQFLKYKAEWNGKNIIEADRWFASSKTCSVCTHKNETLTISQRSWTCEHCGTLHDRDINAAINLKNYTK